jgi:hypothetical protein
MRQSREYAVYNKKKIKTVTEIRIRGKRRKETKKEGKDTMGRCRRGRIAQGEHEEVED